MSAFLWSASLFWAVIYGIRALRSSSSSRSLLPSSASRSSSAKSRLSKGNGLEISIRNFHLEVRSNALNPSHDFLVDFFQSPERRAWVWRSLGRGCYNIGVVFGVLGFFAGIGVLGYSSGKFLFARFALQNEVRRQSFVKRDVEGAGVIEDSSFAINPIIPGVTVPWSHLPFILLALFVAQCFHEAGHALAGAIECLPLHAVGASLTVVLPSAFVSFSSSMVDLQATGKLRVIASGAWHNLMLWGLLYLGSFTKLWSVWTVLGWQDVSELGVVVLDIEQDSPLVHHLQPNSIITSLDDFSLGSTEATADGRWSSILLRSKTTLEQGWCIGVDAFFNRPTSCCDANATDLPTHPPASQLSCFVLMQDSDQGHCIDPIGLLVSPRSRRCFSTSDCQGIVASDEAEKRLEECVRPNEGSQLLRIGVSPPIWEIREDQHMEGNSVRTVLWSGPRQEVWEQVKVGTLAPRFRLLPLLLPIATSTFFSYLSTLSLSLYVFNLFALPFLDGSHFLSALLDYIGESQEPTSYESDTNTEPDVELGVRTREHPQLRSNSATTLLRCIDASARRLHASTWTWRRRIRKRKATIERVAKTVTIVLMCTTVLGMVLSS